MTTKGTLKYLLLTAVFLPLQPPQSLAQQSTASPSPLPETTKIAPAVSGMPQDPLSQLATSETPSRPLYGVQGVLVETLQGSTVAVQNHEQTFNPASAIKLATALIALRNLGPKHRFTTGIWTDGTLDRPTGTIVGNLYISGRDPSLHYEHAIDIAHQLNTLGIRTVTGDLVVSTEFTLNFNWSSLRSGENFYDTLDVQLRPPAETRAWLDSRAARGTNTPVGAVPSVAVMGEVSVGPVAAVAKLLLTHQSSSLPDILKVLLCYSNNFMAERLGESLGGVQSVRRQLISQLKIPEDQIHLSSLSGLGINRMSPQAMMKVFRALRQEVRKVGLSLSDIMPVAGIDPGTLQDRFVSTPWKGSVIAKTGTLVRTDGGVSSLVGQMRTSSGEVLLFVIMNQRGNVLRFRDNQDFFVMQVQNSRGGPKPFNYSPQTLALKLGKTRSKVVLPDEYEPDMSIPSAAPKFD